MTAALQSIATEAAAAAAELLATAGLQPGHILVVGCSTSEVGGKKIGSAGSLAVAEALWTGLSQAAAEHGVFLAIQCCEHLNRALVVPRALLNVYPQLEEVSVWPVAKAGGALAATAIAKLPDAAVVEQIEAHAGLDIGCTLIGMHLKRVAVPVRLVQNRIGEAMVIAARTRPKLIGGERACYQRPPAE